MSMKALCKDFNVSYSLVYNRMRKYNMSLEEAISTPKHYRPVEDHLGNKYTNMTEMAYKYDILPSVLSSRLNDGWTVEKALTTPVNRVVKRNTPWVDLEGNHYATFEALSHAYGYYSFNSIIKFMDIGYTREELFTGFKNISNNQSLKEEVESRGIVAPDNTRYSTVREMLRSYYNIRKYYQYISIFEMLFIGHSLEEAVNHAREIEAKRNGGM